jgi:RNA polymerase-binding transcription factor DksA
MSADKDQTYFRNLLNQQLEAVLKKGEDPSGGATDFAGAGPDLIDQASTETDNVLSFRIRERESRLVE